MPNERLFEKSNEFRASSKVLLKKESDGIHIYFQGNEITAEKDSKITNALMEDLYVSRFFGRLDEGDLKSFLLLTKTEEIVKNFLISKLRPIIDEVTEISLIISDSNGLIHVMWLLSKFSDYSSLLQLLMPFKKKLKEKLNIPHDNFELIIAKVIVDSLSGQYWENKRESSEAFAILAKYSSNFYRTIPSLLIESTSDGYFLKHGGIQALDDLGSVGLEILQDLFRWAGENIDMYEFCEPTSFTFFILKYLPTEESVSYLNSIDNDYSDLGSLIWEYDESSIEYELVKTLFKGLNYPEKHIRKQTQELVKKFGSSSLVGIGILNELYNTISDEIKSDFGKSHKFDFSLRSYQSDFERNLVEMVRYLSDGRKLKKTYSTGGFEKLIFKYFNEFVGGKL